MPVAAERTQSSHQVVAWKRSGSTRQLSVRHMVAMVVMPQFMWNTGSGLSSRSWPWRSVSAPPRSRYQAPAVITYSLVRMQPLGRPEVPEVNRIATSRRQASPGAPTGRGACTSASASRSCSTAGMRHRSPSVAMASATTAWRSGSATTRSARARRRAWRISPARWSGFRGTMDTPRRFSARKWKKWRGWLPTPSATRWPMPQPFAP